MKLWRLIPVLAFVGVLAAATVGLAAVQNIDSDHNFAAEGEENAKSCDEIEVEYGQDNGHVDRVKLHYPAGNNNQTNCGGEFANIEVHNSSHVILCSGGPLQLDTADKGGGFSNTSIDCDPSIKNQPDCTLGTDCVADIDHINIVVTDLN